MTGCSSAHAQSGKSSRISAQTLSKRFLHGSISSFVTHKTILTSVLHDNRGKSKGISGCPFTNRELVKMFMWAGMTCFLQIETEARMGSVCIKSMDAERNSAENVQKESNMKRTEEDMDMQNERITQILRMIWTLDEKRCEKRAKKCKKPVDKPRALLYNTTRA